jgi:tetratricopeptide (TPR) repeat protein
MSRAARTGLICALLVAATWAIYGQVRQFELVDFDDLSYVADNPHVTGGVSAENVSWAFTHAYEGYWSPVTWLSYMADTSLFGVRSGAYHLTNVAIHAANACLLFLVLLRMTRHPWRSAVVAALFTVHPLHVESVAWVAERKDVLSGFFWFLTIWTYLRYVERPVWTRYGLVIVSFACGLMAKPMIVTLPIVLLLLDAWPLERLAATARHLEGQKARSRKSRDNQPATPAPPDGWLPTSRSALAWEKAPLLALSVAMSFITLATQRNAGAVPTFDAIPIGTRMANAMVSPAVYLVKMAWPSGLAAIYPYPASAPVWQAILAAAVLAAITIVVLRYGRRAPYLFVGWLWYLITLLPVLGLIQAGPQARADRYTYLSMVGIAIMAVWGLAHLVVRRPAAARAIAVSVCLALSLCAALAWRQVQYWRDGETLFRRALSVTSGNYVAYVGLGTVLRSQGRLDESIAAYEDAIRAAARFPEAYAGLGQTLLAADRTDAAAIALAEAVRLAPADAISHSNLGTALARAGRLDEAATAYRDALRLAPDSPAAHSGLGLTLGRQDRLDDAVREFNEAIRLNPGFADAHFNLAMVLAQHGRVGDAIPYLREASRLNPASADSHIQLGNALAMQGQMDEAIVELTAGSRLKPGDADVHSNLGIALAARGRFDEAIAELVEAIRLNPDRPELRSNLAYVQARRQPPAVVR